MTRTHEVHIVRNRRHGGWNVTRRGRRVKNCGTQQEAIFHGRRLARRRKVDLVTHRLDGRIRSKDSYRNEWAVADTEHDV
jgi:hypothetical protein